MRSVPFHTSLYEEGNDTDHGAHYDHGMKADQTSLEEIFHCQRLSPSVVVGITDNEAGKYEEEVYCQISVVDGCDQCSSSGKGESFEDVIEYDQQGGYASQSVKKFIVRLCICESR